MILYRLLPAVALAAATPLLMAPGSPGCDVCRPSTRVHFELDRDSVWHEVPLLPGTRYVVDAVLWRGTPDIEMIGFDGDVRSTCASSTAGQTCTVVARHGGVLGILVDSSASSSELVIEVAHAE